jgi:hypothetical protein
MSNVWPAGKLGMEREYKEWGVATRVLKNGEQGRSG